MEKQDYERTIARLESVNDFLESELEYVDSILKKIGFECGLDSVKKVAEYLLDNNIELMNK